MKKATTFRGLNGKKYYVVTSDNAYPYNLIPSVSTKPKTDKTMYAVARILGVEKNSVMVRVPAVMTSIPEIPSHVILGGRVAAKSCDAPLTYVVLDIQPVPVKRIKK